VLLSLSLFRMMTRYPMPERQYHLVAPTLLIAGVRDLLVRIANRPAWRLPDADAVSVPGPQAINHSDPQLIAGVIEGFIAGEPLVTQSGRRSVIGVVIVEDN
jgi:hypothetical protein